MNGTNAKSLNYAKTHQGESFVCNDSIASIETSPSGESCTLMSMDYPFCQQ